jgi:uncharacterized protein YprB with RNaseH-like and TPR domain
MNVYEINIHYVVLTMETNLNNSVYTFNGLKFDMEFVQVNYRVYVY